MLKTGFKAKASSSFESHIPELMSFIEKAVDSISSKTLDEAKIEEIAEAARGGASHVAIMVLVKQMSADLLTDVSPTIKQMSQEITDVLTEAASEAIAELIQEELSHRLQ